MKSLVILLLTSSMLLVNLHATAANHHAYSYHPKEAKEDLHFLPKDNNHGLAKKTIAGHGLYQQSPSDIHLKIGTQQYPQENTAEHHYQHPHRPEYHSLYYNNVAQHLDNENDAADDDGELDIVYHHTNKQSMESTQQEKPTLLDQLKSQAQDLSEGYATFLQIQENDSYTDDNSPQQQQREQQQHHYHYGKEPHRQQAATQLANPQQLHYQKLQQQLYLYYQQLQQQEVEQQQALVHGHSLRQETQIAYQQQQRQQHRQPQQQQLPTTYITPSIESPNTNLSPPPTTTPLSYTTSPQATVQPNLHHQRQPAIVSHATGNEASPHLQRPPHQANSRPHYQPGTAAKFGNHIARQPAVVYGPPSLPLSLPPSLGPRHSKQVIYAPMRFVNDRQLPYSAKTFPYPPSFITLTTTERPMGPKNFVQYPNHKSAYQKIPDFFVNRSSKSLLDSYIPSWQVVKMLEEYRQGQHRNSNLQTLALPYHRNFKRNADNVQGKVKS